MVNLANSYDANATADVPVSTGEHKAEIVESDIQPVSRQQQMGDCLVLTWKIMEGPDAGKLIWQRLNLYFAGNNAQKVVEVANSQFAGVRQATGVPTPQDSSELHNRPCIIVVGPQKNAPEYQEVKRVKAFAGQTTAQSNAAPNHQPAPQGATGQNTANAGTAHSTSPFARPAA